MGEQLTTVLVEDYYKLFTKVFKRINPKLKINEGDCGLAAVAVVLLTEVFGYKGQCKFIQSHFHAMVQVNNVFVDSEGTYETVQKNRFFNKEYPWYELSIEDAMFYWIHCSDKVAHTVLRVLAKELVKPYRREFSTRVAELIKMTRNIERYKKVCIECDSRSMYGEA